jgi:RNA polymerase sigma-70 factor (ECF subfamily)
MEVPVTALSVASELRAPRPISTPSAETLLLRQIAEGDTRAMHSLYLALRTQVYRFVVRIVRDRALAEDLLSEVFLAVWTQAARYEGRASPSTWVLSIARNKALAALRPQGRRETGVDDAMEIPDPREHADTVIERDCDSATLRRCLRQLSVKHAEVVDLVYYQSRSISDVAAILDIPENTVKSRMFLARKQLARMLGRAGYTRALT